MKRKEKYRWECAAIMAAMLSLCLWFAAPVQPAGAEEYANPLTNEAKTILDQAKGDGGAGKQVVVGLEQAIRKAKETFPPPEGYDRFESNFEQSDGRAFWQLSWMMPSEPGGNLSVQVNAQTGDVWRIYFWSPKEPGTSLHGLPQLSRDKAAGVAKEFAARLQPERFAQTRLDENEEFEPPIRLRNRGPVEYQYHFSRLVNGLLYRENGVSVSVDGDSGQIRSFSLEWDDELVAPPAGGATSREQAEEVYRKNGPELIYFLGRPGGDVSAAEPVRLVYRLQRPEFLINALTGELLNNGSFGYEDMMKMSVRDASGGGTAPLTPQEESAVEETKGLLSRDAALEAAQKAISLPEGAVLRSSRLTSDYAFPADKRWHFNWQSGKDAEPVYVDVEVSAQDGELVSFNFQDQKFWAESGYRVNYTLESARQKAEEYIKKVCPDRWGQVKLVASIPEQEPWSSKGPRPSSGIYQFSWVRQVNNIPFPGNGFDVSVSSQTGEITSYRNTWWEMNFPKPEGLISLTAAQDRYLEESGLDLRYRRIWKGEELGQPASDVFLVYVLSPNKFQLIDAVDGRLLNGAGQEVVLPGKTAITDIEEHPAREAVLLLARAGVVSNDGAFRPNDPMTQSELVAMLVRGLGWQPYPGEPYLILPPKDQTGAPWYKRYYDAARRLGLIQPGEEPRPDETVNRAEMARLIVNALGYGKPAALSDIYCLDNAADWDTIPEDWKGSIALAVGMDLVDLQDGRIDPTAVVTRGEGAMRLVKLFSTDTGSSFTDRGL